MDGMQVINSVFIFIVSKECISFIIEYNEQCYENLSKHKNHEKQEMIDIEHKKKYDNKRNVKLPQNYVHYDV